MVVFYVISNENTYPKGRDLKQMYRVVPITKRGKFLSEREWSMFLIFSMNINGGTVRSVYDVHITETCTGMLDTYTNMYSIIWMQTSTMCQLSAIRITRKR